MLLIKDTGQANSLDNEGTEKCIIFQHTECLIEGMTEWLRHRSKSSEKIHSIMKEPCKALHGLNNDTSCFELREAN